MAKKQTRRCVSVRAEIYELIKAESSETGKSMSSIVEQLIKRYLEQQRLN